MPPDIIITLKWNGGRLEVGAELNDTPTAVAVRGSLPLETCAQTWGEEIYFPIPVDVSAQDPQGVVEVGDLAYWPTGSAFCIFFGRTPASRANEPRPASPVDVIGRVTTNVDSLKEVPSGARVTVAAQ